MAQKSEAVKKTAVEQDLKSLFRTLEARPVPDTIRSVVDQLDEGEPKTSPKRSRKRG
jgi:hypothetical protein